ncbi:DEAD/DEAH box helicase family protein [Paenibacillus lycopersici]|uniref:DEAD/DEAH box helicase family protein n=1 Tax=Paenibacillus lycopersici TaxID=2704462 RepID=A0A6C0FVP2_9BACL|nr:DEAD/DEAH box helicase family protein [Paenibacillus lycopersici]QHT59364.1 DEAD/DEAH box helicase family protein [Paenibacillus lycopersici]
MPDIKLITENLVEELIPGIQRASGIYILTSFVMESGVRLLAPHLKEAALRGAEVKLLAGDYLFVTQPEALRALIRIHPAIEVRLWRSRGTSFHPKAYLFDYENGQGLFIVGSSNLSQSAFRMGIEWNLAVNAQLEPYTFQMALDKFMHQFNHENTESLNDVTLAIYEDEYRENRRKYPELVRSITEMEETELMLPSKPAREKALDKPDAANDLQPRKAQEQALEALVQTREEGYDRAMVVMATGLGKTYLAGFFARQFNRVLFVAHREEILTQAARTFQHVMPERSVGLYNGTEKETDPSSIFASIYTLGMKKHRERFAADAFDLIVIDEFHHAAAQSYQAILNCFRPRFLLGITATPDRMDGKDVYAICDGNVAYQVNFLEAIKRGWLSPFQYYGIYDDTDYGQITWLGNRYDEEELLAVQLQESTAAKIYAAWDKHRQTRTIAFCSSITQADFLADYFKRQRIAAVSLHSRTKELTRDEAIQRLADGSLQVIFTVDLFNEGVDIPAVDTLLFVRPTESLTVFTQQVGRGLRLHDTKSTCHVIDLIGNYRNADVKLSLFQDRNEEEKGSRQPILPIVPDTCLLELEVGVIYLLEELARKRQPRREKLRSAYFDLKRELGRRPSYLELHLNGREESKAYRQEFLSYVGFLHWAEELNEFEVEAFTSCEWWLQEAERTDMRKSYKMVVLLAMLDRGIEEWLTPIRPSETAAFFHDYLTSKEYRKRIDFSDGETRGLWNYNAEKVSKLIAKMPMTKWSGSSKGRIAFDGEQFEVQLRVENEHQALVHEWTRQIAEYRLHYHFERRDKQS